MHHVHEVSKARSNHSTLDVLAWRDKSHLFLVARLAKASSDQHSRGQGSENPQDATKQGPGQTPIHHLCRNSSGNGRAMEPGLPMASAVGFNLRAARSCGLEAGTTLANKQISISEPVSELRRVKIVDNGEPPK